MAPPPRRGPDTASALAPGQRLRVAVLALVMGMMGRHGAAAQAPMDLTWDAPEECPSQADVVAEVKALLAGVRASELSSEGVRARGELRAAAQGGWTLRLHAQRGEDEGDRLLQGEDCRELTEAAALILALMVAPQASEALASPPAQQAEGAQGGHGLHAEEDGRELLTGASPPEGSVEGRPTEGSEDPSADALAEGGGSESSPADLEPPGEDGVVTEARGPSPEEGEATGRPDTVVDLRLGALADVGSLPGPGFGGAVQLGVRRDALRLEGTMAFVGPRHGTVPDAEGPGGRLVLAFTAVRLCGAFPVGSQWQVGPCAAMELGVTRGRGTGVAAVERGTALWFAGRAGGRAQVRAGAWSVALALDAVVPVTRPEFVLEGVGVVHRVPSVAGRGELSVGYHFE